MYSERNWNNRKPTSLLEATLFVQLHCTKVDNKTLFIELHFVFTSNQNKTIHITFQMLCVRLHFAIMNEDDTTSRWSTAIPGLLSRVMAGVPRLATDDIHRKSGDQITGSESYTVGWRRIKWTLSSNCTCCYAAIIFDYVLCPSVTN